MKTARETILESGIELKTLAEKSGMNRFTFRSKLNDQIKIEFTPEERRQVARALKETARQLQVAAKLIVDEGK